MVTVVRSLVPENGAGSGPSHLPRGAVARNGLPGFSVRAIYGTKAIAVLIILATFWAVKLFIFPGLPAAQDMIVMVIVLVPTLAVFVRRQASSVLLIASIVADTVAVTLGIYFGGGADNTSGPLLYALIIVLAGLVLSEPANYVTAAGCAAAYSVVVWMDRSGLLPHAVAYAKPLDDAIATVLIVDIYLFLVAWVASFAIRQMRAVYTRAEEMRDEAVSALSHDLKNPLAIIGGYAEIAETAPAEERREHLRRIRQLAQQALDLVRNVLDASTIEDRPIAPIYGPVQVNDLVEQVVDLYGVAAAAKRIELAVDLPPSMPIIHADDQLLRRAFSNLLSNAIKYTPREGKIRVTTARNGSSVLLIVADNGVGIAATEQSALFHKYGRAGSMAGADGSGLGLYIVRRIAEAHGGRVGLQSEPGRGSTFSIELPLGPEM